MSKFKVGDDIECVDAGGNVHITEGIIYTVTGVNSLGVCIVDNKDNSSFFNDFRFKLATKYPNPPHKHRDLIIAWANGAEIEVHTTFNTWKLMKSPQWGEYNTYRIKPTKTEKQLLKEELLLKVKELEGKIKEIDSD